MATSTQSTSEEHGTTQTGSSSFPHSESSSKPIEMSDLSNSRTNGAESQGLLNDVSIPTIPPPSTTTASVSEMASENQKPRESTAPAISTSDSSKEPLLSLRNGADPTTVEGSSSTTPAVTAIDSVAIGPAVDGVSTTVNSEAGSVLIITLLLTSGARHPYKIDEKYLTKRSVQVPGVTEAGRKDPYSISVYTLKELILREWREEWETQPSSPSSIRLIYFGRLLDDKTPLKECKFNTDAANVVHMTVRPQDIVDEEDASKGKAMGRDREGGERTAGCRCVIL